MRKKISGLVAIVLLLPLSLLAVGLSLLEVGGDGAVDFYQYWAAGRISARTGPELLYRPGSHELRGWSGLMRREAADRGSSRRELAAAGFRPVLEFYSTPLLFGIMSVFSRLPYDQALDGYRFLIAAGLLAFFFLAVAALDLPGWAAPAGAGLTALLFLPWAIDLRVGNVNTILLAGTGFILYGLSRSPARGGLVFAGAAGGLLALFKPVVVPSLILAVLALRPRSALSRFALGAVAGAAGGFILSLVMFSPPAGWLWWLRAWREMPPEVIAPAKGNFAPSYFWGGGGLLSFAVFIPALWAVLRGRLNPVPPRRDSLPGAALCLGIMAALVASPLVWIHYSVLALPALLMVVSPRCRAPLPWKMAAAAAGVLLALLPLNHLLGKGGPSVDLPAMAAGLIGLYLVLAAVVGAGWCSGGATSRPALPPRQPVP